MTRLKVWLLLFLFVLGGAAMSVSSSPTLPSVTQSGRTLTPSGALLIGDNRPRTPSGGYTFTGAIDGAVYDVYAIAGADNMYALLPLATGTSVAGRTDLSPLLGRATDYPSMTRVEWQPANGGSLTNHVQIATDGSVRLGAPNTNAQQLIDRYGRLNVPAATTPPLLRIETIPMGPLASGAIAGNDQNGYFELTPASGGSSYAGANVLIARIDYVNAYTYYPFAVMIAPANNAALNLAHNQYPMGVSAGQFEAQIYSGNGAQLTIGTTYRWSYLVLAAG